MSDYNSIVTFLNNPTLPDRILKIIDINRHGLEDHWIIAGGSIANTIYHLLTGNPLVINDIDIYYHTAVENRQNEKDSPITIETSEAKDQQGEYPQWYITESGHYITRREKKGRLDFIALTNDNMFDNESSSERLAHNLIKQFDLNCCQAAILNGRLYYTADFVKFLQTRQIELINFHIAKSLTRGRKKAQTLNAYFDYKLALEAFMIYLVHNQHDKVLTDSIITEDITELKGIRNQYPNDPFLVTLYHVLSGMGNYMTIPVALKTFYELQYLPKSKKDLVGKLSHVLYPFLRNSPSKYLSGNPATSRLSTLTNLLSYHSSLKPSFNGLTLEQQIQLAITIHAISNKYGEWSIGILEGSRDTIMGIEITPRFYELVEERKAQMEKILVKKPLPLITAKTAVINELVTNAALYNEGAKQHHCVGGYGNSVENGSSRIISIRDKDGKEVSTAEIRMWNVVEPKPSLTFTNRRAVVTQGKPVKPKWTFRVAQHRANGNSDPSERHQQIVKEYVKRLNEYYRATDYFKRRKYDYF